MSQNRHNPTVSSELMAENCFPYVALPFPSKHLSKCVYTCVCVSMPLCVYIDIFTHADTRTHIGIDVLINGLPFHSARAGSRMRPLVLPVFV